MLIHSRRMSAPGWATAAVLSCAVSTWAHGEGAYNLTTGLGYSDNITRAPFDPIDEQIASIGVKFSQSSQGTRLQSDLVGDLAFYDYLQNTYDSEVLGNFIGTVRAALVPETLNWVVSDNYGQVLSDPFVPSTPENRDTLNYISTGPDAGFEFGTQTRLTLGARYAQATYQNLPLDSHTVLGQAGLARLLSHDSSIGLNVRVQRLEYDESTANSNFDQSELFLRYSASGARTLLHLDAGYNQLDLESSPEKKDGALFRLDVRRNIGARSSAYLAAGHDHASSSSSFAAEQADRYVGLDTAVSRQSFDPYTEDYVRFEWDTEGHRTSGGINASYKNQVYDERPDLDQKETLFGGSLRHDLTPVMALRLAVSHDHVVFADGGHEYTDFSSSLSLQWQVSRFVNVSFAYDRDSRNTGNSANDYTENRLWLAIGYGRGAPRSHVLTQPFGANATGQQGAGNDSGGGN